MLRPYVFAYSLFVFLYVILVLLSGRSLVVEHPPSKRRTGVRFSPPALGETKRYTLAVGTLLFT